MYRELINCLCIEYTTLAASSAPSWIQCLFDDLSLGVGGRRWAPFQDTRPPDISICQPRSSQEAVRRQSGGSPRPGHTPPPPSSPSGDFYNITWLHCLWCGQSKCTHIKWISSMRAGKGQNMLKILLIYLKLSILNMPVVHSKWSTSCKHCKYLRLGSLEMELMFLSIFKPRMHQF